MTNKTELLPCPCCEGEAKEMYTPCSAIRWIACLKCGLETKGFGNAEAAEKAWNNRVAPAEDVRPVVEEPAAWMLEGSVGGSSLDFQISDLLDTQNRHGGVLVPLARQAQRGAVMPELQAFANDMISAAYEGGSFDGGDIQDIAVKHGLLQIEQRVEACGEHCACSEYGFPAECYRRTDILKAPQ